MKPNISLRVIAMAVMLASAGPAMADEAMTREQVKAELAEANRVGSRVGAFGMTENEIDPSRYSPVAQGSATTACADADVLCRADGTSMLFLESTEVD